MTIRLYVPSQGQKRRLFEWRGFNDKKVETGEQIFFIQYKKELSFDEKLILESFNKKHLYHAIEDILNCLKSKPRERDNLLAILYSPVRSLENNFPINFFDIWINRISINDGIDEVSMDETSKKVNKFLTTNDSIIEPYKYITIELKYTNKPLKKEPESLW